jgi:molybdenum cofactor cytidylyltransferase
MNRQHVGALILAAGMSSRMKAFKPLLPLGENSIIETVINRLKEGGAENIVIVTGHNSDKLETILMNRNLNFINNPDFKTNHMFDSVLLGISHLNKDCDAFLLIPADIPQFLPSSIQILISTWKETAANIVRPVTDGKKGHPILISRECIKIIKNHNGVNGLKGVIEKMEKRDIVDIEVNDRGILYDADTALDYEKLKQYRWNSYPTESEILDIYNYFKTPADVIRHCTAVKKKAMEITDSLEKTGFIINRDLIRTGALVHDAARIKKNHPETAAAKIYQMGYGMLGDMVKDHMDLPSPYALILDERSILYLADKLVQEDRPVTLEQRFGKSISQFGNKPEILSKISRRWETAQVLQDKITKITSQQSI